jgi:hypothetical protein
LVGILTTKPLIFIKEQAGGQADGRAVGWPCKHEQGWIAQLVYIINVKLPNLEPLPQGISYQERERETQRERERERDSVQRCQIQQDFRVAKKAETPNLLNLKRGGQSRGEGGLTRARHG